MQKWAMKCKYNHDGAAEHTETRQTCDTGGSPSEARDAIGSYMESGNASL